MKELEYIKPYSLKELITKIVHQGYTKDNFCLYTKEYEAVATPELVCYLDRYPEVSDDEDVYPEYVEQNELELFLRRSVYGCSQKCTESKIKCDGG